MKYNKKKQKHLSELTTFLEQKVIFFFFLEFIVSWRGVDQTKSRGQIMKNQMNNAKKSFKLILMCDVREPVKHKLTLF